jgi:hypothetical protein
MIEGCDILSDDPKGLERERELIIDPEVWFASDIHLRSALPPV